MEDNSNIRKLLKSANIIPSRNSPLLEQYFCLVRLIIFVSILLILYDNRCAITFFAFSMFFITCLYSIQKKNKICKESYKPTSESYVKFGDGRYTYSGDNKISVPSSFDCSANCSNTYGQLQNTTDYTFPPPNGLPLPKSKIAVPSANYGTQAFATNPQGDFNTTKQLQFQMNNFTTKDGKAQIPIMQGSVPGINNTNLPLINTGMPTNIYSKTIPVQDNNPDYVFKNHLLSKGHHPFTEIAPVIAPPSHDLTFWKMNELITHSAVNTMKQIDNYASGYSVTDYNGNPSGPNGVPCKSKLDSCRISPCRNNEACDNLGDYGPDRVDMTGNISQNSQPCVENFTTNEPRVSQEESEPYDSRETYVPILQRRNIAPQPGWVDINHGYNPNNLNYNLPANMPVGGNCNASSNLSSFNKNLFTQTLQPGVYSTNQVAEPINSNIGISFQQQFEPVNCSVNQDGIHFNQVDPYQNPQVPKQYQPGNITTENDVYDPRFNGYGTSYRSYTDPTTGQPRFAYDDVNAVRMPNYITRSKIDFINEADTYGSIKPGSEFGNPLTRDMKTIANDKWVEDSIGFRNDMSERLMRKRNAELWQTRMYPRNNGNMRYL
jgi:hypothetical protein